MVICKMCWIYVNFMVFDIWICGTSADNFAIVSMFLQDVIIEILEHLSNFYAEYCLLSLAGPLPRMISASENVRTTCGKFITFMGTLLLKCFNHNAAWISNYIHYKPLHALTWTYIFNNCVNSSPPRATYMPQWTGSTLVQIMACRLFGAKPLSKSMLGYCQLDP